MSLKKILNNHIIFLNILSNLETKDKQSMSLVNREINKLMNMEGYFDNIVYNNENLDKYVKFLDMYDRHKRYIRFINIYHNNSELSMYMPKVHKGITIKFDNCKIKNSDITKLLKKVKILLINCYVTHIDRHDKNNNHTIYVSYSYII